MIAKHVPMRSLKKSDFAELVNYITDGQGKVERLGNVRISNCAANTLPAATAEVLATQRLNTRAEGDRTYHLLVSFRAGENPSPETLREIEDRICDGLGFTGHQRVSAVHNDTDNLHIHIAINKIHPERGTIHEPFKDYRTLSDLCTTLERDYGLEPDNHRVRKRVSENRAEDMERHAGIESLAGWIKRECLCDLRAANSWDDLHRVLQENGLKLRERGNGFIFQSDDGTTVKASTVARDLSKPKLEERLGQYEAKEVNGSDRQREYDRKPLKTRVDTTELYAQYRDERQGLVAARKAELKTLRADRDRRVATAKRANRLRRAAIKMMGGGRLAKRFLYSQAHKSLIADLARINADHRQQRQALHRRTQRLAWADWLKAQALKGNEKALVALRAREAAKGLKGNTIEGEGAAKPGYAAVMDNITKKGTIIYRVGASAVRDDGDRLQVSRGSTEESLQAALQLAKQRFGERITVNGTADFKERIARAAATGNVSITFDDAALEQRRQELLKQEGRHERQRNDGRRRGQNTGSVRSAGGRHNGPGSGNGDRRRPVAPGGRSGQHSKPNIAGIGRKPPPQSQNRLRALSELGVVRIASGIEVLLPRDVSGHMDQQTAQPDHALRRGVSGSGRRLTPEQQAVADKYIAEREQKRLKGFDIPKHRRYTDDKGELLYAGRRTVQGQNLALLRKGEEILVLPVDAATTRRMKRLALGEPVSVTPRGSLKTTRGRSR